jgi:hypothetical protein
MVESMLREFPNVLTLRVRMPIVMDLTYPRNFITKVRGGAGSLESGAGVGVGLDEVQGQGGGPSPTPATSSTRCGYVLGRAGGAERVLRGTQQIDAAAVAPRRPHKAAAPPPHTFHTSPPTPPHPTPPPPPRSSSTTRSSTSPTP